MPSVRTHYDPPPIPMRNFDWTAVLDNYDGAEDAHHPIGSGPTEIDAILDLWAEIECRQEA